MLRDRQDIPDVTLVFGNEGFGVGMRLAMFFVFPRAGWVATSESPSSGMEDDL